MIGFIAIFFTVGDFDIAYAAETADKDLEWATSTQKISTMFQKFLYPVLMMIGALLENDLLFGAGMETVLNNIWIPIRNLVNILFILVLVGIALYNVLGLGEEGGEYAIKSALPKIIAALIVINFSFLGIKVLLDGVNALTISILALPNEMGLQPGDIESPSKEHFCQGIFPGAKFYGDDKKLQTKSKIDDEMWLVEHRAVAQSMGVPISAEVKTKEGILGEIESYFNNTKAKNGAEMKVIAGEEAQKMEYSAYCVAEQDGDTTELVLTDQGKKYYGTFNSKNAAMVLAMNFNKLGYLEIPDVNAKNAKDLLMNALFSLIIYITLTASFFALFFVLLFRIVFMWVAIAISPILVLLLFSPTIKEKLGGGVGEVADKFMKNAFAPVPVALALTVGFIMLKAVQTSFDTSTAVSLGMSPTLSFPVTGLSTPQDLIVMTGTIAVIWMGVFGAAEGTLAEGITNSIKGGVEKVGKGLATLPIKHMPTGLTNPDTGEDIKLGEFAPLLQQTADKISQPMRGLADSVYQKAPPATDAEISKLDKKNAPEILKKIVANNPENMSKTRKEALYKKLKAMKPDERRKIDGLPEFYKELKAVKDKDPKDSQSLKGASTKLAATLGANTGGINTKALGGGKRPATEPGQRDTPTPAVAPQPQAAPPPQEETQEEETQEEEATEEEV